MVSQRALGTYRVVSLFLLVCSLSSLTRASTVININFDQLFGGFSPRPSLAPYPYPSPSPAPSPAPSPSPSSTPSPAPSSAPSPSSTSTTPSPTTSPFLTLDYNAPLSSFPANQWVQINTGGRTLCSLGGAYAFFVRLASLQNLQVELQGGGACFDTYTCDPANNFYNLDISDAQADIIQGSGNLNYSEPLNPYLNWTHVYVSYCSADFDFGNRTTTYGNYTIMHRGIENTYAVTNWLSANFGPIATNVSLTSCSAGGFAATLTYPIYRNSFPKAQRVSLLIDSASEIAPSITSVDPYWNVLPSFPNALVEPYNLSAATTLLEYFDVVLSKYSGDIVGSFAHDQDQVQTDFCLLGLQLDPSLGVLSTADWTAQVVQGFQWLLSRHPNFHVYFDLGTAHCVITSDLMYTTTSPSGVSFIDFMVAVGTKDQVPNVDVTGLLLPFTNSTAMVTTR